ncbi:hypothetical protein GSI_13056 [Ganoderma sinense ZZ0214-1]|uniref:Uncharacterized protein n=1 Tax=Ganoderma sinense ZZ0214-1 TaxID=1077348 RepID=A0A2G8RUH8_9APHY|nr:hypothetical protein GSI_13056 [Ganoderma sinense ZZ0214-1]
MVVTRRTPAAPVPTSRNPSSQPIPRVAKKPTSDTPNVPAKPSPLSNGSTLDSSNRATDVVVDKAAGAESKLAKSKGKQKSKKGAKKKSKGSPGFLEFVFRLVLLWFTIYTLAVCPEDLKLQSPVCRGLAQYRALVIEPYILPPIERALAHPSVAPYVAKAKPYVDHAVRTAKPVAARAHKEFNARVVPQWNKRVMPLYHKYAVPQLVKLDAQTAPYRTRAAKEYEQFLAPYVRHTASTVYQLQEQARPYIVLAAQKSYQGYQVARPYARPLWEKTKLVLAQLTAVLGEQRRQFVDPHVQKIWEHVKEMSSGKPLASSTPQARSTTSSQTAKASSSVSQGSVKVSSSLSSVLSSAVSGSSAISSSVAQTASRATSKVASGSEATSGSQTSESTKSSVAEAGDKASSVISSASGALKSSASAISKSLSSTISSVSATNDAVVSSAASLAAEALSAVHGSVDSASFVAEEIPAAASSMVESGTAAAHDAASEAVSSVARSTAFAASAKVVGSSAAASAAASVTDSTESTAASDAEKTEHDDLDFLSDPDLDAFKAELGLSEEYLFSDPVEDSGPAEPHVETEEEREARLEAAREKNARDRASLVGRHAKWEAQLVEEIQTRKKALRKTLVAIRKEAVVELKANEEIRNEVDSLIEDGEKFLRGAEKYLANLRKESRTIEEKRTIWDRIVSKVEEKFNDRLHRTEAVVNGWYKGVLDNELAEVDKLAGQIKDLAERAQADIGLEYAYLDDVTYQDWQRYHDLVRRSENFTAHAHSVQDGSHPSPPINPVTVAIKELQDEVDDVIAGFNARLRKIKRSGARVFGSPVPADEEEQVDESASPADDEGGVRNVLVGRGKGVAESASVLPVEDPEQAETPEGWVRNVVVGRGKGEVEAALNRVAEADAQKTSSEHVAAAEAVAQSLSDEFASAETSEPVAPVHQEL